MKDSRHNKYVRAEIAGGGRYPVWRVCDWWQSAHITIMLPKRHIDFYFPEGKIVDSLGHGIANLLNWFYAAARK